MAGITDMSDDKLEVEFHVPATESPGHKDDLTFTMRYGTENGVGFVAMAIGTSLYNAASLRASVDSENIGDLSRAVRDFGVNLILMSEAVKDGGLNKVQIEKYLGQLKAKNYEAVQCPSVTVTTTGGSSAGRLDQVDPWQRFTERARKVVFYAQEEAQKFGEGYVSTEHLLLGLVRESDSVAARVLERLGVSLNRIRAEVEKQLPRGDARPTQGMSLTPRAKRVIDLAYDEARNLNNNYIGTEHLLLGLIREGNGLAGRVLEGLGVEMEAARDVVKDIQVAQ